MIITIQFTGLARQLTDRKQVEWQLPEGTSYARIVELLATTYPDLVGPLIGADGKTFLSSNMFIINGDMALPALVMEESPQEGDCLTLVSVMTGG